MRRSAEQPICTTGDHQGNTQDVGARRERVDGMEGDAIQQHRLRCISSPTEPMEQLPIRANACYGIWFPTRRLMGPPNKDRFVSFRDEAIEKHREVLVSSVVEYIETNVKIISNDNVY